LNQSRAGRAGPRRVEDGRERQIKAAQRSRGINDKLIDKQKNKKRRRKDTKVFPKNIKKDKSKPSNITMLI